MAEKTRKLAPATLLILLAVASFAAASITITNITEWHVYAKTPPIVKVDGKLMGYDYGKYVNVTNYFAEDGTNRTVISVLGFTGDPVRYDNVIYICNKDYQNYKYKVKLVYKQVLEHAGTTPWDYVQWIKLYFDQYTLTIPGASETGYVEIPATPGSNCVPVSVEVLVKPEAKDAGVADGNTMLVNVEVDVVAEGPVSP